MKQIVFDKPTLPWIESDRVNTDSIVCAIHKRTGQRYIAITTNNPSNGYAFIEMDKLSTVIPGIDNDLCTESPLMLNRNEYDLFVFGTIEEVLKWFLGDPVGLYRNNRMKWTREDEEKLLFLFKAGKTVEDLSEIFSRKPDAITRRLKILELVE